MCQSLRVDLYPTYVFGSPTGVMIISYALSAWIRPLMSPACFLCGQRASDSGLCKPCLTSMPTAGGLRCPICFTATATASQCGRCLQRRPEYDRVVAALDYVTPVDHLVTGLKYSRDLSAARALAFMLARVLEHEPYPDVVLAMPIAPTRLRERGFNQAEEIARYACAEFGLNASRGIAQRTSAGSPQASLPLRERARNVRGVFECNAEIAGKTIAIVDDVLTTGATLDALAGALKRAGARSVTGWIVARTPARL